MNLLKETIGILATHAYELEDIEAVQGKDLRISVEHFARLAEKTEYDEGFGAPEVATDLVLIMKDGAWFSREEYDGSEWWQYHNCPKPFENIQDDLVKRLAVNKHEIGWRTIEELVAHDSVSADKGDTQDE